jgi:exonuclease SbcC
VRILAIRGQNLASLERAFEVALDAEPLASAGLFAITGNTGAGKSTLLDAMCAALFDRTPRLEGRSPFQVGRGGADQVGAFDVRALLRRGAGEGWAEVDFEGKDRRRYRARWEVHRARRKAEGKLQDQQLVLRRLDDGVVMGGTRGETLKAIENALGLSFEQFKRSSLLAQGEFAAFLRAESSARAALLERMTGTALYGALSMAAHRRAAELAAERRGRRGELDAAVVLDDERRAALARDADGAAARTAAARARVEALARASRWREQLDELTRAEIEAGARAEQAERAVVAAAGEARELATAEQAEPVRAAWQARARARLAAEHARRIAAEAEAGVAAAKEEAKRSSEQAMAARQARRRTSNVARRRWRRSSSGSPGWRRR